jgi:hypothetical protein
MTTSIIFKIDPKLKKALKAKVKKDGITLTLFFQFVTRLFVAGKLDFRLEQEGIIHTTKKKAD